MKTTQVKKPNTSSITFPVDKVEKASNLLLAKPYQVVVEAIVRQQSIREAKLCLPLSAYHFSGYDLVINCTRIC